jgi:hypothetical protein
MRLRIGRFPRKVEINKLKTRYPGLVVQLSADKIAPPVGFNAASSSELFVHLDVGSPSGDLHPISSRPCWAYTLRLERTCKFFRLSLKFFIAAQPERYAASNLG